ncbi:alcohol dehydrogenase catalytic domain-containing protein [Mycobacterium sp. 94-17]|uniref:alcohol dehydrogenase catalytic domain-containing protein n=1 Tax=Mycobacterium sp. 94-17 TaxID=2986147 RepID=UPI002D1F6C37|nr:alcohol dehydrogenase catalytic domain-containing protein [Mycobacterium sp. 94-17]MEB4209537.1 alcohol dehydrogenase catalytic domain-containing protein [Mycobacterium sp. 94-17]
MVGGTDGGLVIGERPDPVPLPHELVIEVHRCGICKTDLHMTDMEGFMQAPPGVVLGHEFAGTVVEIGSQVTRFGTGDHITSLAAIAACGSCPSCVAGDLQWCTGADKKFPATGGYAQYAPVAEHQAVKLPRSVSLADAALVEPLAVALHGIRLAHIQADTDVLVLGAGPIGLSAALWAKRAGARKVLIQATSRRLEALAMAMGADAFVTMGGDALGEVLHCFGKAPDVVVEAVGAPGVIEQALRTVAPRGTVVVLGWCGVPDSYTPAIYLMKEVRLQFSMTYNVGDFEHAIRLLDDGAAEPPTMVTRTIGISELPAMFARLRGATEHCKVLVDPWLEVEPGDTASQEFG